MMVDSEYNITGYVDVGTASSAYANFFRIIDWGFASMLPIQLAARLPCFLQLQQPILQSSLILQEDRNVYLASLRSHVSEVASWMVLVQSSEDVDFRHCFLESILSKGMHYMLARLGWQLLSCTQNGGQID